MEMLGIKCQQIEYEEVLSRSWAFYAI